VGDNTKKLPDKPMSNKAIRKAVDTAPKGMKLSFLGDTTKSIDTRKVLYKATSPKEGVSIMTTAKHMNLARTPGYSLRYLGGGLRLRKTGGRQSNQAFLRDIVRVDKITGPINQ